MTDQVEQESVDLVENESEVSEGKGHNPETAPADALASTDAAAKVVKQAPEPKTKGGKISAIMAMVQKMPKAKYQRHMASLMTCIMVNQWKQKKKQ